MPCVQPIHAFKNPGFKKMLDIASRPTHGVTLLAPKKTHVCIIHMFKEQMFLKKHLNVRSHFPFWFSQTLTDVLLLGLHS